MIPKPIGIRILAKKLEDASDGIILPPGVATTRRAAVVAIGEDVRYVEIADELLLPSDDAHVFEFRYAGENWLLLPERAVLAVLDRHPSRV